MGAAPQAAPTDCREAVRGSHPQLLLLVQVPDEELMPVLVPHARSPPRALTCTQRCCSGRDLHNQPPLSCCPLRSEISSSAPSARLLLSPCPWGCVSSLIQGRAQAAALRMSLRVGRETLRMCFLCYRTLEGVISLLAGANIFPQSYTDGTAPAEALSALGGFSARCLSAGSLCLVFVPKFLLVQL